MGGARAEPTEEGRGTRTGCDCTVVEQRDGGGCGGHRAVMREAARIQPTESAVAVPDERETSSPSGRKAGKPRGLE